MDNLKYYYIKLKDNYFEQDNIKVLESLPNGHIYSLILIKMYLKASKFNGQLMMTSSIPYDPNNLQILASVLNHDVSHVRDAIRAGVELDLITIVDGREIWLNEIQNMIGRSSTEADRIRAYRQTLGDRRATQEDTDGGKGVKPETVVPVAPVKQEKSVEYDDAKRLCVLMEELHKKHDQKYRANLYTWIPHVEKLLRIDKREPDEIEEVIRWVKQPDNFWFPNIMSGRSLRDRFPTLLAQMRRDVPNKPKEKSLDDIAKKYEIRGE